MELFRPIRMVVKHGYFITNAAFVLQHLPSWWISCQNVRLACQRFGVRAPVAAELSHHNRQCKFYHQTFNNRSQCHRSSRITLLPKICNPTTVMQTSISISVHERKNIERHFNILRRVVVRFSYPYISVNPSELYKYLEKEIIIQKVFLKDTRLKTLFIPNI